MPPAVPSLAAVAVGAPKSPVQGLISVSGWPQAPLAGSPFPQGWEGRRTGRGSPWELLSGLCCISCSSKAVGQKPFGAGDLLGEPCPGLGGVWHRLVKIRICRAAVPCPWGLCPDQGVPFEPPKPQGCSPGPGTRILTLLGVSKPKSRGSKPPLAWSHLELVIKASYPSPCEVTGDTVHTWALSRG